MNRIREERINGILSTHFSEIDYNLRQRMAPKLAREFDGRDELGDVERIAVRLSLKASAHFLGMDEPLPADDPRRHAKIGAARAAIRDRSVPAVRAELVGARGPAATEQPSDPARGEDGRFVAETIHKGNPF